MSSQPMDENELAEEERSEIVGRSTRKDDDPADDELRNTTTGHSPTSSANQEEQQPILISTRTLKMILMPFSLTSELQLTGR